jgi:hypothetical protein
MEMTSTMRFPRLLAAGAALAAGLLVSDAASAQYLQRQGAGREQGTPPASTEQVGRRVEQLTQQLQLSAEQAANVRRILEQEQAYLQERGKELAERETRPWWGKDGGGARRQQGPSPETRVFRQRAERQIERLLNDAQRARYRQLNGGGEAGQPRPATQPRG